MRPGFSLLEMMAAVTIAATLMAASTVVLRSSYAAWQAHEGDLVQNANADAVLRHVIRGIRQADSVVSITDGSDTTGKLELRDASGNTIYWEHTAGFTGEVVYNAPAALLARDIDELIFVGYKADGVTTTTNPNQVQLIHCTVKVTLPRGAGQSRALSCYGWVRSW